MDGIPELEQIFNDLKVQVDTLVKDFASKLAKEMLTAAAPGASVPGAAPAAFGPKFKSLPWFQHGVRGFLRKLWYGDHPENPNWNKVQREGVASPKISLEEYNSIKTELYSIISETTATDGLLSNFLSQLMSTIATHLKKAYSLGYERTKTNAGPVETPPVAPEAPAAPIAAEPEPTPPIAPLEKKKRGTRKAAPLKVPAKEEPEGEPEGIDQDQLETIALKVSIAARNSRDQAVKSGTPDDGAILAALKNGGIRITGKNAVSARSAETVVRIMQFLATNGDLGLGEHDWTEPIMYRNVLKVAIPSNALRAAIQKVGLEQADRKMDNKGDMDKMQSPDSGSVFEALKNPVQRVKMQNILESRKLSGKDKAQFLLGCLSN